MFRSPDLPQVIFTSLPQHVAIKIEIKYYIVVFDRSQKIYSYPKMSHPHCVYINNRCEYQSITQQYLKDV